MLPWKNPEFIRHWRADLRPARALTVLGIVLVICFLIWMGCWGSAQAQIKAFRHQGSGYPSAERLAELEKQLHIEVWLDFYRALIYAQLAVLSFWSLLCCAQAISGERERKTWDFQRATRLSPGDFMVGKLFGEPIVAYFIVCCCLPVTFLGGLLAHAGFRNIVAAYVLIFSGAAFLGLAGLWISNLFETRSRGVGLIGTFGLYVFFGFVTLMMNSSLPGMAALSPLTGVMVMFHVDLPDRVATIFGKSVPWLLMSLLLYATFGAWLVLMILRGLKRDFDQIKPLSRWQAVGCAAFLDFTLYALFQPCWYEYLSVRNRGFMAADFTSTMIVLTGFILFAMGLAMLAPHDGLRTWWRNRTSVWSLLSEDGPPWPWLLISGVIGYALLVWGMFAWKNDVGFDGGVLLVGLIQSLTILAFVTRDILFLQWCRLTRMRAPLLQGMLYLALYYISALILSTVFGISSAAHGRDSLALLTPAGGFDQGASSYSPMIFAGFSIQVALIVMLLMATNARLKQTITVSVA